MTAPVFLLVHGWGFDAGFWDPLRRELAVLLPEASCVAWDLGFLGKPARPPVPNGRPLVAVGHSMGLLWLLKERPVTWDRLVSINGFPRFTRADDLPQGVAPRLVERMISRLAQAPAEVYQDFMTRCGVDAPTADTIDPNVLGWGLRALADWDCRADDPVDLALLGRQDVILPPPLADVLFQPLFPKGLARWHDGGHLLPRVDPVWCAQQLRTVVESMK